MKMPKLINMTILMIASTFTLSACAVKPLPPPDPGTLTIKILQEPDVQFVQTFARQDGENIVVVGQVKRTVTGGRSVITGHVDIEIIDKDGKSICQVVTNYSPKIIPERNGMMSSFTTRIPMTAPQESFVSVKFHRGPHGS